MQKESLLSQQEQLLAAGYTGSFLMGHPQV